MPSGAPGLPALSAIDPLPSPQFGLDDPCAVLTTPKANLAANFDSGVVFVKGSGGALRFEPGADRDATLAARALQILGETPEGLARADWERAAMEAGISRAKFREVVQRLESRGEIAARRGEKPGRGPAPTVYLATPENLVR